MTITEIQKNLRIIEAAFDAAVSGMEPLTQSLLSIPEYFLSRLLLATISRGSRQFDERGVRACLALEFLEQALTLGGFAKSSPSYNEDNLLVSDYLYAQAIDQVIKIDEPEAINSLALAITRSAEDKAAGEINSMRRYLVVAVFDIGLMLGDFTDLVGEDISSARTASMTNGPQEWLRLLPEGPLRDHLEGSTSVGVGN